MSPRGETVSTVSAARRWRLLIVTSYYSTIEDFVEGYSPKPHGMPAISNLWSGLRDAGIAFDHFLGSVGSAPSRRETRRMTGAGGRWFIHRSRATSRSARAAAFIVRAFAVLRAVLREGPYDLVYVDRGHVVEGALISLFLDVPVVLRLHGVTTLPEKLAKPGLHPMRWLRRLAFGAPFACIISSDDGSPVRSFIRRFCNPQVPAFVWLNGVPDFKKKSSSGGDLTSSHSKTVLFLARLNRAKGAHLFVEAARILRRDRQDFEVLMVGDGPLREGLARKTATIPDFKMVGSVPHDHVGRYYEQASVFVSLNDAGNLNNTVLEALQAGSCILTYGKCPNTGRDVATEGRLGDAVYFVQRGIAPGELAKALDTLLDSDELRSVYQRRAEALASKMLRTWPDRIADEIRLLDEVARSGSVASYRCTDPEKGKDGHLLHDDLSAIDFQPTRPPL